MMRLFLSVAIVAIIKVRHSTSQQERKIESQTNLARTLKMPNSMTLLTSLRKYRDFELRSNKITKALRRKQL